MSKSTVGGCRRLLPTNDFAVLAHHTYGDFCSPDVNGPYHVFGPSPLIVAASCGSGNPGTGRRHIVAESSGCMLTKRKKVEEYEIASEMVSQGNAGLTAARPSRYDR